jgi:hypothetical protein
LSCAHKDQLIGLGAEEVKIVELALDETIGPDYDSTKLYVFINDTLGQVPDGDREFISRISQMDSFSENFASTDTSFKKLVLGLIEIKNKKYLDVESLNSKYEYKIRSTSNWASDMADITLGAVTISRVVFSDDNQKACVYTRYVCEGDCGGGQILFFEKNMGKWKIVSSRLLWVS